MQIWFGHAMSSVSHLFLTLAEDWSKRDHRRGIAKVDPPPKLDTAGHAWRRAVAFTVPNRAIDLHGATHLTYFTILPPCRPFHHGQLFRQTVRQELQRRRPRSRLNSCNSSSSTEDRHSKQGISTNSRPNTGIEFPGAQRVIT